MTARAWSGRDNLAPAFSAALALHLAVFAAVLMLKTPSSLLPTGAAVPIEIVSSAPAQAAAEPQAPAPVPLPVQPAAPPEKPMAAPTLPAPPAPPAPPEQRPQAATAPAAARPPRPVAPRLPDRPARPLNLDALAASIAKATSPPRPAAAPRGAVRKVAAAPAARAEEGQVSQNDLQGLQQLLERLWNPNCGVAGADSVIIPVKFAVGPDGRVNGRVAAGEAASADPAIASAARRAIDAVREAEPFESGYRGKDFTVNFDARKACSER